MTKSYVTLEQNVCHICGKTFDTNSILMDRSLRDRFDHHTITGYGICPEDQAKLNEGYYALIAVDPNKSREANGRVLPEHAYRTGAMVWIRRAAYERLCNIPLDEAHPWAFCDPEVITKLAAMMPPTQEGT
jgi:hypothetical protein